MAIINKQDTDGTKSILGVGEFGYDNNPAGGDAGRVYVGDGTNNIPLSKKIEVDSIGVLKADKATTYTKSETDTALDAKADKILTYTKTEVDTLVASTVGVPTLGDTTATAISSTNMMLNGLVTSFGATDKDALNVGFEYRVVGASVWSATAMTAKSTLGSFSQGVNGLSITTNYEFRAKATDILNPSLVAYSTVGTATTTSNAIPTNPTNTGSFATQLSKGSTTSFTFSGATDSDGSVTHYLVDSISSANLTVTTAEVSAGSAHTFNVSGSLSADETVTFSVKAKDNAGSYSSGVTITVTLKNVYIVTPTLTVAGTPSDVAETPSLTTSAFSVSGGTDTHASTDWQVIRISDGAVVWESLANSTNKLTISVPSGILVVSTSYTFKAKHNGTNYGTSGWASVNGTTKSGFSVVGNEVAKINATDKQADDYFGYSVSISSDGTTLAVGAYIEDPDGVNGAGSVYIYKYNGSSWVETKINASDKQANDYFGQSVSLSSDGTTLAVGAIYEDPSGVSCAGSVYIYKYNGSSWVETKITASDKQADDYFGYSVSISSDGTTLAVGAYIEDPDGVNGAGSVYIYKYNGSSWVETKINASDKQANDYFGNSVSISSDGTTLAVGAYAEDPSGLINAGSVYLYKYNGSSWVETKINASDRAEYDYFGNSVSLSSDGTTLAVGAREEDPSGVSGAGSVYVFKYNGSSWIETKIIASDKEQYDQFGWSVSISSNGTTLAVGARDEDPSGLANAGSVYIYKYNGSSWVETKIVASDKEADDLFGFAVSISSDGTTLAVGVPYEDPSGVSGAGSVYIYK